jgi:hypothetical protein
MKAIPARVIAVSALLAWIHCQSAPEANGQNPWRFAFGTPTSITRIGFTKVTVTDAYTLEKGYGFLSTQGLEAFDRGGSEIVRPKDEYTASVYGAYRTTSDLTCALNEGTTNNAFQVTLPDGEYTIWLIASDAEWDPPLFEVWANGEKKLDVRIPRAVRLHGTVPGACYRGTPQDRVQGLAWLDSGDATSPKKERSRRVKRTTNPVPFREYRPAATPLTFHLCR